MRFVEHECRHRIDTEPASALPVFIDLGPKGSGSNNFADFGLIQSKLLTDGFQGCRLGNIFTLGKIGLEDGPVIWLTAAVFLGPFAQLLRQAAVINLLALGERQTKMIGNLAHVTHSLGHIQVAAGIVVSQRITFRGDRRI